MIEVKPYQLPEVVDREALREWQQSLQGDFEKLSGQIPGEVQIFIDALAAKLPDFGRIRNEKTMFTGYELLLAGMNELNGEAIERTSLYPVEVPFMQSVDNRLTMMRLYLRKGKSGLIDYVKARTKGTEMERLLMILNVHVFHQEREEFKQVMDGINNAKKLDSI